MHRDDHEEDVRGHDRAEHRPDLDVGGPRCEQLACAPRRKHDEGRDGSGERAVVPGEDPAEGVVDEPCEHEPADRDRDRLPGGQVGDSGIDEEARRVREVDDDEEREPGEPGGVGLPLEPVEPVRQALGRDAELLDPVEAAAVDLPDLAADTSCGVRRVGGRLEVIVERNEVERRADPGDPGHDVQPAEDEVAPAPPVVARR